MLPLCRLDFPSLRATYDLRNYHHMSSFTYLSKQHHLPQRNHLGTLGICSNDGCQLLEMFLELLLIGFSLVAILRDV